jgi:hypothetical protein
MSERSRLPLLVLALALVLVFHRLLLGEVFFWGLPALQFVPWREYAFELVRGGQLPLWNPYNGAGAPLLANYQSALLYPPHWPGLLLPLPWSMSVTAVLHLFIAGWGMWAFAGRLGLSGLGRGVSALAFALSGYLVARLGTYPIIETAAWLPWLLWAAHGVITTGRLREGGRLALLTALMLLAGHAQTAWYSIALVGVYSLWAAYGWVMHGVGVQHAVPLQNRLQAVAVRLAGAGALLALGAGVAAIQLMPTAELLRASQRAGGVDYDFAMNFSYAPARILNLFSPNVFGNPGDGSYLTQGAFFEDAVYVGLIPLVSAVAAFFGWLRWRRTRSSLSVAAADAAPQGDVFATVPLWWGLVIVAFVFALGRYTPVFPFLYENVPTFDLFQAPVRWHLWTVTGLSILAGIGVSAWGRGVRTRRWAQRALAAYAGCILVGGLMLAATELPTPEPTSNDALRVLAGALIYTAGVGALAAWLTLRQPDTGGAGRRRWTLLVLLIIAADLAWAAWGLNPTVPAAFFEQREAEDTTTSRAAWTEAAVEAVKFGTYFRFDDYRYATENWFAVRESHLPNLNLLHRVPLLDNFDPLRPGAFVRYAALVERATEREALLQAAGVDRVYGEDGVAQPTGREVTRAWLVASVCWHTSEESLEAALLDPDWQPHEQLHMLGDGGCPDAPLANNAPPVLWSDEANRVMLDVNAPYDGWLVLADVDYPGWTARLDGEPVPIYRANGAFRAVQVSPGAHTVTFEYAPGWLVPGVLVSVVSLLAALLVIRIRENDGEQR